MIENSEFLEGQEIYNLKHFCLAKFCDLCFLIVFCSLYEDVNNVFFYLSNLCQVRFWNIHNSCYSNTRSPSSIRRRVTALSCMQRRKLFSDEKPASIKNVSAVCDSNLICHQDLPDPITVPEMSTPISKKRKTLPSVEPQENFEKTPEAAKRSPSSVLNPPSSLRKTIRDYFLVTPPSGLHSK